MTLTLSSLMQQSGLTHDAYAEVLGINEGNLTKFLAGRRPVPEGVISDALQILEDIQLWEAILRQQQKNGVYLPHWRVIRAALYNIFDSTKET